MAPRKSAGKGKKVDEAPPRPRVRGSSSSGGANREDEAVEPRFVSLEAQNVFYKVLQNEVLLPSMRFDWVELDNSEFAGVFDEIINLGLRDFLGLRREIFEDAVREFYANLSMDHNSIIDGVSLKSRVSGKEIFLCESNLCTVFNLPRGGVRPRETFLDFDCLQDLAGNETGNFGYSDEKGADLISRLCSDHSPPFEAMDLPLNYRLLHYAINRVIYPKRATNNQITSLDREIIWHMEEGRKINYPSLILQMMRKKASLLRGELQGSSTRHKGMPYAALIAQIAQIQRCDLSNYTHYPYPSSWRFTPFNLRSMRLVKTVEKGWVYAFHVEKQGLSLAEEQVPTPKRPKRTADRPSSSRPGRSQPRPAGQSEATHDELLNITAQLDDLNDRVDGLQEMFLAFARKAYAQHNLLKKIFNMLERNHDDSSS